MTDFAPSEWIDPAPVSLPPALGEAVGGHALVAETLVRRGITDAAAAKAFLDPRAYQPASPFELPNLSAAVERLRAALRTRERICVWGDFDVDGLTSTALLLSALRGLGGDVILHIPSRAEGHGLNAAGMARVIEAGAHLVLSCDTGVTGHRAIDLAQAQGTDVIVTDHHDLPPSLPQARAVVNPKMLDATHPLHELPGVGVAYELAHALAPAEGRGWLAADCLDLVALGVVADVAIQTNDTRYLLQRGLCALRSTPRLGLRALMETAELEPERITETHIGFVLAPRINALGRLADARAGVELMLTDDLERARTLATEIEGLNARRRLLVDQVTQSALNLLERDPTLARAAALVLDHPSWPVGLIGIVAGRLANRFHRPAILIATPEGELGRGSARSVEGCDIRAALAVHAGMLERFGGHPMAAGFSIAQERIPEFRTAVLSSVERTCAGAQSSRFLRVDAYLDLSDLSPNLVDQLERLAPFGPGNPPLTLASRGLVLTGHSSLGRTGEHLRLTVEDERGADQTVIWWQGAGRALPEARFDLAYVVRASDYRGRRGIQIEWVEARPANGLPPLPGPQSRVIDVVDLRSEENPARALACLRRQGDLLTWSEGGASTETPGQDRYALRSSKRLVVWTTPPGPSELRAALGQVSPEVVFLIALDPDLDRWDQFLARLAGLLKHALRAQAGRADIRALAAATAQREATARAGIDWLAAHGDIVVLSESGHELSLGWGDRQVRESLVQAGHRLHSLLEETAAYRRHVARADADALFAI